MPITCELAREKLLCYYCITVEPRSNEPLFNEVLDITNDQILRSGQSYSKMYGIKPRYNEPRYNEFFDITNIIRKPKRKLCLDITNYNVNTRQKINVEQINSQHILQSPLNPYGKGTATQQPFSQWLITCRRHWHYSISTEVTCVTNQSLTMTSI